MQTEDVCLLFNVLIVSDSVSYLILFLQKLLECLLAFFDYVFEQPGFTIKQQVFDRDIPTPLLLFEFLQMLPVKLYTALPEDDDDDKPYNPWKESDDTKVPL